MRKAIYFALFLGLITTGAPAAYFDTNGNDYYARCTGKSDITCFAVAGAFLDMMNALGYKCTKDIGVSRQQAKDILIKYMTDHPADRHITLAFSAILAFQDGLGCAMKPQ
jgi:hypothetical protein